MIRAFRDWFVDILNVPMPTVTHFGLTEFLDVLIMAVILYFILRWIKRTQAWFLFKGIAFIIFISFIAEIFNLITVQWLVQNAFAMGLVVIVILFQPELRKVLEQVGRNRYLQSFTIESDKSNEGLEIMADEIIKAARVMSGTLTGALIVIEQSVDLTEYEKAGIPIDAQVSSKLIVNIFERNTPLHDGAIIIRNNRIAAATCILPLSDESMDASLGTRHRAAKGISEASDARVIVVSEETGTISIVISGIINRNLNDAQMQELILQGLPSSKPKFNIFKKKRKRR